MSETNALTAALGAVDTVVGNCITWVGDWLGCITSNPLLLMFMLLPLVGIGVGFIKRLIRV